MCPRTKEQNEQIRKKRMFQIRRVAAEVYLQKGLRMEIGDIAQKAGIGRGTIYHYYNNKIALLEDLLLDALQEAKQLTEETLKGNGCPAKRLEAYARAQLSTWMEQPFIFILYKNFFQDHEPLPINNSQELERQVRVELYTPVMNTIREGTASDKLADVGEETAVEWFFGTLIGTAAIHLSKKESGLKNHDHIKWVDDVMSILWNGLQR
ncbi:TetR/AcrR family transcriptional regulator [Aneurinibacillus sp. REN35]|uniref:TetR/AcrR family transcriptional regulator n=1 Tax=Aneurinibacillus sp. REN35 TaxID=3237286 RepID=UPI003527216F